MKTFLQSACVLAVIGALAACASPQPIPDWEPAFPEAPPVEDFGPPNGAIFQQQVGAALFSDLKARQVGDTLTVRLVENTTASTSASTNTSKETNAEIVNPTVFGRAPTRRDDSGALPLFGGSMDSTTEFDGTGSSSQSNSMQGSMTVTVYQRLPNGNLMVKGERWITVNQGREFLRIAGIVRPADIGTDNSVPSFKIADARIDYRGTGAIDDANRQGWLARFFQSPWMPF
ncbi:flagellar basal body L-ring protein FlgH [Wenzhouxiangella limi]|uniref:Flagellar L-ring protein n=1 Tax=Wenzhouxiangella limi TaxID=2707351 RepID=A0A845V309_9GAMM|nr:flagellar basal body L-ring protein FlgH [Wenzhouxiangella limi]NDY97104.1 flagellar basal body L-ring protein FlgH [Wenzhouxiangella limi]